MRISLSVVLAVSLTTAAFVIFALGMALKAKLRKPTTGKEGLLGEKGVALTRIAPGSEGQVKVHGEIWTAWSDKSIRKGQKIRVVEVQGLTVKVEPAS